MLFPVIFENWDAPTGPGCFSHLDDRKGISYGWWDFNGSDLRINEQ
jgi:hypothetical protein